MWRRLPLWLRAILTGLAVTAIPTTLWAVMATANFRLTPAIPWAAPIMGVVLWVYWRFLRKRDLRVRPLSPDSWGIALLAGWAGVSAVWAAFMALQGVLDIASPPSEIARLPVISVLASIFMGATVAGICEEAGFRGYMQLPLERAYGPLVAIGVTSILFTLIHLTHGLRILPYLPFFFAASVTYGVMTHLTGSILPAVSLHLAGDVLLFLMRYAAIREGSAGLAATGTISFPLLVASAVMAAISVLAFRSLSREAVGDDAVPA